MTRHHAAAALLLGLAFTVLACTRSSREANPETSRETAPTPASAAAPTAAPTATAATAPGTDVAAGAGSGSGTGASDAAPAIGADVGNRAPDFTLAGPDGSSFTLSGARARPLVLVFFRGTW